MVSGVDFPLKPIDFNNDPWLTPLDAHFPGHFAGLDVGPLGCSEGNAARIDLGLRNWPGRRVVER